MRYHLRFNPYLFFFKQKTAYEMRISDWSSDVCSSDLHAQRGDAKPLMALSDARGNRFDGGWADYQPPAPRKPGISVFDDYPLTDLVEWIDWTPFFQTWELSGRDPDILDDAVGGEQATSLFNDAKAMLAPIVAEKWLTAKAGGGRWPAGT